MCRAAGFEPIITTTAQDTSGASKCCAPDDMADLVEYCYGNSSTEWGRLRIADGHPDPYDVCWRGHTVPAMHPNQTYPPPNRSFCFPL